MWKKKGAPEVSVVIPAYNEARTIGRVVQEIHSIYPAYEVIVVNDGSTDETALEAFEAGAHVLSHPYNIGNGAAVKTGIRHARGDFIVLMDGDGQHNPADIKRLVEGLPQFDMIVGARSRGSNQAPHRLVANRIYNWFATYVAKYPILDLTSGFRAIKRRIALSFLYLLPNTFSYPTTITLALLRAGRSVNYVPVKAGKRTGSSKIRLLSDGLNFFLIILKVATLFAPLRVFMPMSFLFFAGGLGYYAYSFFTAHRFTNMSLLLFTTGIVVFMLGLISEQIAQLRFDRTEEKIGIYKPKWPRVRTGSSREGGGRVS